MLIIMYVCQFSLAQYIFLSLLLQLFAFLTIQSLDEAIKDDVDNRVAFDFPGQGIKVAPASESVQEGFILYCPCMGKYKGLL